MAKKFRGAAWADLCDTSQEGPQSPSRPPLPLNAESYDSYCQTPDPFEKDLAENTEAAMNLQLEQMFKNEGLLGHAPATSSSSQPSGCAGNSTEPNAAPSFTAAPRPAVPVLNLAAAVAATDAATFGAGGACVNLAAQHSTKDSVWQPNAMATTFIPTGSLVADAVSSFRVAPTPVQPAPVAPAPPVRRRIPQKRSAPSLVAPVPQAAFAQASAQKRPLEAVVNATANSSLAPAAPTANRPSPPAASEEDWERRRQKRCAAVQATKDTLEYKAYKASIDRRGDGAAPGTPDANAPISKRSWEEQLRLWRLAVRAEAQGGATA